MHIAALFAHPDDLDLWAGGTVLRHLDDGDHVTSALFYECNDARLAELRNARQILTVDDFVHSTAPYTTIDAASIETWLKYVPEIVITHWNEDAHLEHRRVFDHALLLCHTAKRRTRKTPMLLMTSTYYLRGVTRLFEPEIVIDVTATMTRKRAAIDCYASQHPKRLLADVESQNRLLGSRIGVEFAEGFVEYPLFGFTRSMSRHSLRDVLQAR